MVWTLAGPVPMAALEPGQMVLTALDGHQYRTNGEFKPDYEHALFRRVRLHIEQGDGSTLEIDELLPSEQVEQMGLGSIVGAGAKLWLKQPGIDSADCFATVLSVGQEVQVPAPIQGAAPITALVTRSEATLLAVQLEGDHEPLLVTATHPLWSVDRGRWVNAGELKLCERIATLGGQVQIESIRLARPGSTVYNLSVADGHTFFVGEDKVWAHNCWTGFHHLIPEYMRGLEEGLQVWLSHDEHVLMHRFIDDASAA